ncbi:MAG: xanthine dehydrogenase family protein molybdopterin-binding subunit [Spirochaetales bacterium]|nr:xanthine dehydrogenase family protein molybdopterin-binding subunit [Spirochaetales bacterium]
MEAFKDDFSRPLLKVDNEEKISGKASYLDDKDFGEIYHILTVRSTVCKGRIKKITLPPRSQEVHVVDFRDIPGENFVQILVEDWPVLAEDRVAYLGEPILLLAGPDKAVLEEFRRAVTVEYDREEPLLTLDEAVEKSEPVQTYKIDRGDYITAADRAHRIYRESFETGRQEQVYIEPQGVVAEYGEEGITLTASCQCPYYIKNAVMNTLGWGPDRVRVIQAVTGGAFGGKEEFPSLICCQAAVACVKLKKTVKILYPRSEDMAVTTKRHPARIEYEAALDEENRIQGIRMNVKLDGGATTGLSAVVLQRSMISACGVYAIPAVLCTGGVYLTNTVPNGAFRGFGAPQTFFALETFMNHLADLVGEDRVDFKRKHLAKKGDLTTTGGIYRDPILLPQMIDDVMERSRFREKSRLYADSRNPRGVGFSFFLHGCGFTGSGEAEHIKALVRLKRDEEERVHILVSNVDMGQGFKTSMIKVVSHTLELPPDRVIFREPDTKYVPDSGPTVASRSAMIVGRLLWEACEKLRKISGPGTAEVRYRQPDYIRWDQDTMSGDAYPAYSWGVDVIEVEVDRDSCETKILGIWTAHEAGRAVDSLILKGQVDGGLLQGVGYGLWEKMEVKEGRVLQNTVTDYIIATAADFVHVEDRLFDNPYALGPYGAKGAGELTLIGGAPAVAAAVEQALGVKVNRIPLVPEYLMELKHHG